MQFAYHSILDIAQLNAGPRIVRAISFAGRVHSGIHRDKIEYQFTVSRHNSISIQR
ncbi:MAG: hypothetical protein U0T81_00425 [Saprospiraceae bacterium]